MKPEINPIEDMMQFEIPEHIKKVESTEIQTHYCFSCGHQFSVEHIEWCQVCHWAKCPICGGCACTLTKEAQMAVRGIFLTFCQYCNNPCKRKKHHSSSPEDIPGKEPKWRLVWEQEDYPKPGKHYGKLVELEKTFESEKDMDSFIKESTKSAKIIGKPFNVKKVLKCDKKGNWCEEYDLET